MADTKTLPPLPFTDYSLFYEAPGDDTSEGWQEVVDAPGYTADQMRAYARAAIAAQAQGEPVACDECVTADGCAQNNQCLRTDKPLYTAPPPAAQPVRKPMTEEQRIRLFIELNSQCVQADGPSAMFTIIVQAVERAHGITGEPAQPVAVPDGYALVPVEPTLEMIEAGDDEQDIGAAVERIYRAMLSAAPKGGA